MSIPRFYCPEWKQNDTLAILDEEANHAIKSLRMKLGDLLVAFDGKGNQAKARIVEIKKREMLCQVIESAYDPGDLPGDVEVAVALPKGDRQKLIVERLVEMGIHRLIPLQTARSVAEGTEGAIARLQRYAVEASKQSGRNRLLRIEVAQNYSEYIHRSHPQELVRWVAHPYAPNGSISQPLVAASESHSFAIAIGPEGGLTEREVDQALDQGWKSLRLGSRILRVESAVSYVAALVNWYLERPTEETREASCD